MARKTRKRRKRRGGGPEREAARAAIGRRPSFRYGADAPSAEIRRKLRQGPQQSTRKRKRDKVTNFIYDIGRRVGSIFSGSKKNTAQTAAETATRNDIQKKYVERRAAAGQMGGRRRRRRGGYPAPKIHKLSSEDKKHLNRAADKINEIIEREGFWQKADPESLANSVATVLQRSSPNTTMRQPSFNTPRQPTHTPVGGRRRRRGKEDELDKKFPAVGGGRNSRKKRRKTRRKRGSAYTGPHGHTFTAGGIVKLSDEALDHITADVADVVARGHQRNEFKKLTGIIITANNGNVTIRWTPPAGLPPGTAPQNIIYTDGLVPWPPVGQQRDPTTFLIPIPQALQPGGRKKHRGKYEKHAGRKKTRRRRRRGGNQTMSFSGRNNLASGQAAVNLAAARKPAFFKPTGAPTKPRPHSLTGAQLRQKDTKRSLQDKTDRLNRSTWTGYLTTPGLWFNSRGKGGGQ